MLCNKKFQWSQICGEDWKLYLSLRNSPYISILRTLPNPGERNSVSNVFFRDSQGYLMTESLYQPTTVENNLGDLDLQVKDHICSRAVAARLPHKPHLPPLLPGFGHFAFRPHSILWHTSSWPSLSKLLRAVFSTQNSLPTLCAHPPQ